MARTVAGLQWDRGNREKCQNHGVSVAAIEAAFRGPTAVFPDPAHSRDEERFEAVGRTTEGRHVPIVFTLRRREGGVYQPDSAHGSCTRGRSNITKELFPAFRTDNEAERFVVKLI